MRHINFLSCPPPVDLPGQWPFIKMHGLHNYFVIVDRRDGSKSFDREDIVRICDCHTGPGGEQLLTIEPASDKGRNVGAYAAMRIFNIDGKEVGACGNATRCIAYLLLEETGEDEVQIETKAGVLHCRRAGPMQISVTFGPISMDWRRIPLSREVDTLHLPVQSGPLKDGLALDIGNPHAVFFVDCLELFDMAHHAPVVQNDPLFPEGINVDAAEVLDGRTLRLAVWERPGILTKACGTGACVAAYAALKRGLVTSTRIAVHLPAGLLKIEIANGDMAVMTGPVAFCCHGFIEGGKKS
ncbi:MULTISPECIES: diaminopimelate epimerase [Rhizobium]|uniref:diaminopimelate epimerase n=1 Tax=Rhizobium TaxID=379 RepID=UPI000673603D|nr:MULTISPECIES: diaminopimelate epimerase [Rhizobium]ANK94091.1 diaminopimelate epimerase 2 [Rhizobium sp. N6212]ANL00141.1 diaminopimelate epimerase 2 [Rhizobium sp. N621]ANL06269.1 diaminopimelate epimerase 2 [Rhizobium esperanzae]ANL12435.1 diaminopimelate epimerase 2 [Rhizobium sp. N1341]ANL24396.1 diaminopimelate epimerase 2 [Rhizobium sp. N113]